MTDDGPMPGETQHDWYTGVVYQRDCDAEGCDRGLLLSPARFCTKCGGSGYLLRFPEVGASVTADSPASGLPLREQHDKSVAMQRCSCTFGARCDTARLLDALAAERAKVAAKDAEIERLRQGLWDVYAILGFDTDGDPTPAALVTDLVSVVVAAAREARADWDGAS